MKSLILTCAATALLVGCASSRPDPLSAQENAAMAQELRLSLGADQAPIMRPVTLYEAMARALKFNLKHRITMMELDLSQKDYALSGYDQLPQIVANGGYYGRNNDAGARSLSLLSGRESLEPSTSTERDVFNGDLTASWNILDFGLSKIRSQQLGNDILVQEERRRKAIITIMEDVHRAYYRAVSAEKLSSRLNALEADVRETFMQSRQQYRDGRTAPMPALTYQRELNDIQADAQSMARELSVAKMELGSLMGLNPSEPFQISVQQTQSLPGRLSLSFEDMIDLALQNRPEIRESAYAMRNTSADIKAAALEGLPSLSAFAGLDASSNDFLFNKDWVSYGAKASWNLMKLFTTGSRKDRARAGAELERQRTMATAQAVMTQVAVSRARYNSLWDEYQTAGRGAEVQSDITGQIEAQWRSRATSKQTLVRERMNAILSEARRDAAYAELQEASANIYTAMGYDPYAADISGREDIDTIAASLETLWTQRAKAPAS